jgi:putative transcriptional regulator
MDPRLRGDDTALSFRQISQYIYSMDTYEPTFTSLAGHFLIAMPHIGDPRFHRAVIFVCAHDPNGAMGLMLTQPQQGMMLDNMLEQLEISYNDPALGDIPVLSGGPVEQGRGFVLHGPDYHIRETVVVNETFSVTATVDVLKAIAEGSGPGDIVFALGYAGWQAGQLENELKGNAWLTLPATHELVFNVAMDDKWDVAMTHMGIDPAMLSATLGNA